MEAFKLELEPEVSNYSRKFVEFCSLKALSNVCFRIDEMIPDGTFSHLTFDMMLSWENPSATNERTHSVCFCYSSLRDIGLILLLLYLTCWCMNAKNDISFFLSFFLFPFFTLILVMKHFLIFMYDN